MIDGKKVVKRDAQSSVSFLPTWAKLSKKFQTFPLGWRQPVRMRQLSKHSLQGHSESVPCFNIMKTFVSKLFICRELTSADLSIYHWSYQQIILYIKATYLHFDSLNNLGKLLQTNCTSDFVRNPPKSPPSYLERVKMTHAFYLSTS